MSSFAADMLLAHSAGPANGFNHDASSRDLRNGRDAYGVSFELASAARGLWLPFLALSVGFDELLLYQFAQFLWGSLS